MIDDTISIIYFTSIYYLVTKRYYKYKYYCSTTTTSTSHASIIHQLTALMIKMNEWCDCDRDSADYDCE